MKNQKIIVKTAAEREKLFIRLYKDVFPSVARYVSKMGGTLDDAKDIFQDALVIWYEKAVSGMIVNEKAYLAGVAKHLRKKKNQEKKQHQTKNGFDREMEEENQPSESRILN